MNNDAKNTIIAKEQDDNYVENKRTSIISKNKNTDNTIEEIIESGTESNYDTKSFNKMCYFMKVVATIVYVAGFVVGFMSVTSSSHDSNSWMIAAICWLSAFVCGSLFLGLSEVIKLLHYLHNKED